jgi:hypothetical protein
MGFGDGFGHAGRTPPGGIGPAFCKGTDAWVKPIGATSPARHGAVAGLDPAVHHKEN